MSVIEGKAKRYDGTPVDYVSIFNWTDGKCIHQVIPDAAGNWEYEYFTDLNIGITYVADGCEPITHGAYQFIAEASAPRDTVLHYTFNGDLKDKSINLLHGVHSSSASFVEGRKPNSLALSLSGGHVRTQQLVPINSDKITISFWFNTTQDSFGTLFATDPFTSANMVSVFVNSGPDKAVNVQDKNNGAGYTNKRSTTLPKGVWNHLYITVDRAGVGSASIKVFMNGVQESGVIDQELNITGSFANRIAVIGARNDGGLAYNGLIQDFRVYNRILSADERAILMSE